MPISKRLNAGVEYRGRQTKTGNSSGFRFEAALFKSHPEFNGEVTARVIAPGRMLVMAETEDRESADPVMASFLSFLAEDIARVPQSVRPLDAKLAKRMDALSKGVVVSSNEDLGPQTIL
jgi:prlF antitoxin for toxin YhaV_toxin